MVEQLSEAYEPIDAVRRPTKVYSVGQIAGGTLFGGPLAGALFLASNYSLFRSPERRRQALICGVVVSLALIPGTLLLPETTPNSLIPGIYTLVAQQIAHWSQRSRIVSFLESGGTKHSHWRVVGIGVLCILAFFTFFFLFVVAFPDWVPESAA